MKTSGGLIANTTQLIDEWIKMFNLEKKILLKYLRVIL